MTGTGDRLSVRRPIPYGMIVTILNRLEGAPAASANSFSDVAAGKYYTNAVAWAAENKIVGGYGERKIRPEDAITREQMSVILKNYAKYKGYDVSGSTDLSKYTDGAPSQSGQRMLYPGRLPSA